MSNNNGKSYSVVTKVGKHDVLSYLLITGLFDNWATENEDSKILF